MSQATLSTPIDPALLAREQAHFDEHYSDEAARGSAGSRDSGVDVRLTIVGFAIDDAAPIRLVKINRAQIQRNRRRHSGGHRDRDRLKHRSDWAVQMPAHNADNLFVPFDRGPKAREPSLVRARIHPTNARHNRRVVHHDQSGRRGVRGQFVKECVGRISARILVAFAQNAPGSAFMRHFDKGRAAGLVDREPRDAREIGDSPAGQSASKLGDILLRVAAIDTERVQFEDFAREVFIQTAHPAVVLRAAALALAKG